jgi:hypothetical protein
MIEGLVMEVHRSYVIVLSTDGEYLKLKKVGEVNVGDTYTGKEYKIFLPRYAAAAVVLFLATTFGGYTAYANQIVGVVNISGEKDVKLYISRNGQVKKVEGLNETSSLKNMPVDKAVEKVNEIAEKEGIFNKAKSLKVNTTKLKSSKVNLDEVKSKVETAVNKDKPKKTKQNTLEKVEDKKDTKDNNIKNNDKKDDPKKDTKNDDKDKNQDVKKELYNKSQNSSSNSSSSNNSSGDKKDKNNSNSEKKNGDSDKEKNDKNIIKKN